MKKSNGSGQSGTFLKFISDSYEDFFLRREKLFDLCKMILLRDSESDQILQLKTFLTIKNKYGIEY